MSPPPALPGWPARIGWFVALYAGGVLAVGGLAFVLRLWLEV